MKPFVHLTDLLEKRAESGKGITFIHKKSETALSYRELYEQSLAMAAGLRARGIRPRDEIVLQIEDLRAFVIAFWSCILGGFIPVPVTAGGSEENREKLRNVWRMLNAPTLLTDMAGADDEAEEAKGAGNADDSASGPSPARGTRIQFAELEGDQTKFPADGLPYRPMPDDIAFLQFSSGSTGEPKGVILTHGNLIANMNAIVSCSQSADGDSSLSWMPLTHDMGLIGFHLSPIYANMNQYLMQPAQFMLNPMFWLEKVNEHRISSIASPNFGYKHFLGWYKKEQAASWDLSCVKLIFNGAEPISAEWADKFVDELSEHGLNPAAMFPVYGMAEASLAVTFPPVEERLLAVHIERETLCIGQSVDFAEADDERAITFVDVGYPVMDCEVRICGMDDTPAPQGAVGNIQIRGANVTQGYYNNPSATEAALTSDGWLRTGDIGFFREGRLVITGRHKEIIFVRGQNIYPHDLEKRAEAMEGVGYGKTAVCGARVKGSAEEEIVLFVQHKGKLDRFVPLADRLIRQLNRETGYDIRYVIPIRTIPRTTSGKTQRFKLVERLAEREWDSVLEEMEQLRLASGAAEPVEANAAESGNDHPDLIAVKAIWQEALGSKGIRNDDHFMELGGNSLKGAYVLGSIQRKWGIELTLRDLFDHPTPVLLWDRIREEGAGASQAWRALPKAERGGNDQYPVSVAQKRMYLMEQADGIGPAYQIPLALSIAGALKPERIAGALEALVDRHETLRTSYHWIEGDVVQRVHPAADITLPMAVIDRTAGDFETAKGELEGLIGAEGLAELLAPFDLSKAPMLRSAIYTDGESQHLLLLNVHHIASDGIGMNVLMQEFASLLKGEALSPLENQYKDFAVWESEGADAGHSEASEAYWRKTLSEPLDGLNWPGLAARPERRSYRGGTVTMELPAATVEALQKLVQQEKATLSSLLLTLFSTLLYRYSSQSALSIGMLLAGRTHPDTAGMVGMFNNYVPIRIHAGGDETFHEVWSRTRDAVLDAFDHIDIPYEKLVELSGSKPDRSRNPLFDTMLVLHNQAEAANVGFDAEGCRFKQQTVATGSAKLDLKLDVFPEQSGSLTCILEYNEALLSLEMVERMSRHLARLAEAIVKSQEQKLAEIELMDADERRQVVELFNDTAAEFPRELTLHEMFRQQAERTPERIALSYESETLTYRELHERSDRLASHLRGQGVKRGEPVGLMAQRSAELMIGVLAIIKAGGAYVPLPPEFPEDRLRYMAEGSGLRAICVQRDWMATAEHVVAGVGAAEAGEAQDGGSAHLQDGAASLEGNSAVDGSSDPSALGAGIRKADSDRPAILLVDLDAATWREGAVEPVDSVNAPDDLAYILYTSGSTGRPKGVMIRHESVINRIHWMQSAYPLGEGDVILQKTPYSFDVSVWELFWWMLAGASVAFLPPGAEKDPAQLVEAIGQRKVTTMHFVPSMLAAFLETVQGEPAAALAGKLATLKHVFASGEALHTEHVERFYALTRSCGLADARLINLYGPTEATVDVSVYECVPDSGLGFVPIGRPIDNTALYIVSGSGQAQPIGVPGELCIAGVQLASGYANRPDLTAEKFVPNPFAPGTVMYRTGDLARWMENGEIQYLGRIDDQVKVRGYRIELGEIERILLAFEPVSEAVVTVREDGSGDKQLCGYVVADRACTSGELRRHCGELLPDYMIPAAFVQLEAMPLTASGKADRRALPSPDMAMATGTAYEAPASETEEKLVALWRELLQRETIGVNDNFFELGGHSLKAATLTAEIHREFQCSLPLRELFNRTTVRELAQLIDEKLAGGEQYEWGGIPKLEPQPYYPLSSPQNRLFVLQSMDADNTSYHLPSVLYIHGQLNKDRLRSAVHALVERHETLRTSFVWVDGRPMQSVAKAAPIVWEESESEHSDLDSLLSAFIRPFALDEAPLLRVKLIRFNQEGHVLLLDMHHLISDGVSSVVLAKQFVEAYESGQLPELPIQYKDYAHWQQNWLQSEEAGKQQQYWLDALSGEIPVMNLPFDYPRPPRQDYAGDSVSIALDSELAQRLSALGASTGTTLYMTLLAAFTALLHRYTGQEDIWIGSPVAGRPHVELSDLIGMFVNTVVLRGEARADQSYLELLEVVKERVLGALENDRYPFEELVDKLAVRRDVSRNPLFDVMFVLQNTGMPKVACGDVVFEPHEPRRSTAKFDLTLEVAEGEQGLRCQFEYRTSLFRRETVERLASHWLRLLEAITSDPALKLAEIELMDAGERRQVVELFNDTAAEFPRELTLHEMFRQQAERTPERIALSCESETLTYRELHERSHRLASHLRGQGVKRGEPVGLMAQRSAELMIGVLAIIKAGGAYVPLPPEFPEDRLRYMAEGSGLRAICVQRDWMATAESVIAGVGAAADGSSDPSALGEGSRKVDLDRPAAILLVDLDAAAWREGAVEPVVSVNAPDDLAYILYTSGSTGRPKGVMIRHESVINRIHWMQSAYPLGEGDVILQKTPYSFDVSVWELFWWMLAGASVAFLPPGAEKDPAQLVEAIGQRKVTTMHFVPSMLAAFLETVQGEPAAALAGKLGTLKHVFASGEALHTEHVERFYALTRSCGLADARLINLYGPTEATVDVSVYECVPDSGLGFVPIGRPIDNTALYIVSGSGQAQPIGVPGELCIAGVQLASGYANRPDLTAEKFVPNPFVPGTVMYRTGDLARWMENGEIQYLGRIDDQVKVRGYRIELGEIERILLAFEPVSEAVVTVREDGSGDKQLCGYVVADRACTSGELRRHCGELLPDYMIPAAFVQLEVMPLTASGKADRRALPSPDMAMETGTAYEAPASETEERLAALWRELLQRETIGVNDNFFELGGNSLLLIRMHRVLEQELSVSLSVTDLFAYPTIAKLAEYLTQRGSGSSIAEIVPIPIPADWQPSSREAHAGDFLRVTLGQAAVEQLNALSEPEGVDSDVAALAVYVVLLAQNLKQPKFELPVYGFGPGNGIVVLPVDLTATGGLSELIAWLNAQLSSLPAVDEMPIRSQSAADISDASIVPLYRKLPSAALPASWMERVDLLLNVGIGEQSIQLNNEYNGSRIRKEKVKELMQQFPTWCRRLASQQTGKEQAAAARD
ncbi:Tyrocidine synthase 3 [Paenibacillus plantiphilus]|uniref:Tyrocidine synthase 3 n=1 Tax=Paenibacillus plantiphilus TaxID=2905650 RepID=A0ABN8GC34_9BACL|nr:non-ribosomal peptide synthetase [Paenibacillus plantiphilus]CAH1205377.1 Tyrocidine synthase 3 [Paenibacillus plantiphilus]